MSPLTYTSKFTLAVTLLPPCMLSLRMMAVPETVSSSTYAAFAALLIALGVLTFHTHRNGHATGIMGQLLYAPQTAQPAALRRVPGAIKANRSRS